MSKPRTKKSDISRRKFIVGSAAAAGGGLALGFHVPFGLSEAQAQNGAAAEVNVWVAIKPDETVAIRIVRAEMGQGSQTGLAQLKRAGRLVLVGAGMARPRFDPNRILLNELEITGAFVYDDDGFERALAMLAEPGFPTAVLIEPDDVGLHELRDAIGRLGAGEIPAKVEAFEKRAVVTADDMKAIVCAHPLRGAGLGGGHPGGAGLPGHGAQLSRQPAPGPFGGGPRGH